MLARLLRLNNPWMIGALTGAGIAAASGLFVGRLPLPLYWFGQLLIGISIGSRFKREVVLRLPSVFVSSAVFVLILAALLFGYAAFLCWLTGLDLASATRRLAWRPGRNGHHRTNAALVRRTCDGVSCCQGISRQRIRDQALGRISSRRIVYRSGLDREQIKGTSMLHRLAGTRTEPTKFPNRGADRTG